MSRLTYRRSWAFKRLLEEGADLYVLMRNAPGHFYHRSPRDVTCGSRLAYKRGKPK